jgi:hypothetical protein
MPQRTKLYIVASQHPGVGKTLVCRLLIEYFRHSGRPPIGYDLNPREPALAGYFPNLAWPVDIAETRGQMALFDRLIADKWRASVVDLGYGLFEQFFKVMGEIGFAQEARRQMIDPIVLFIADAAPTSARGYAELRRRLPETTFVPVHNEAAYLMFQVEEFPPTRRECGFVRIPRLSSVVSGVIDRPGFSFADYMSDRPGGPTEIHAWTNKIFEEFRDLELRLLLGEVQSSLRGGAKPTVRKVGS